MTAVDVRLPARDLPATSLPSPRMATKQARRWRSFAALAALVPGGGLAYYLLTAPETEDPAR